jgi:hypothetical protein
VADRRLTEPLNRRVADRRGIGFGWLLQNAWLLHARLKIHRGGIDPRSVANTENPRAGSLTDLLRRGIGLVSFCPASQMKGKRRLYSCRVGLYLDS